jgi:hypothetical protein
MPPRLATPTIATILALAQLALPRFTAATERRFTFTYETATAPKGHVELENWVTWRHSDERGPHDADLFQFRHELEFGVTDKLQFGLYFFDWRYDEHDQDGHRAAWEHSGIELIYNLTNPTTDFLGSALYLEALVGENALELEGKLLLQKNFGPLTVAYNAILEAEWEGETFGEFEESNGVFGQTVGISYDLAKSFSVGAEVLHEIELPGWKESGESALYAGPNASARLGRVFATVTTLFQLSDHDSEPDFQVRLITGFQF